MWKRRFRFFRNIRLSDGEIRLFLCGTASEVPEKGYVPTYYFDIIRVADGANAGRCDLRAGYSDGTVFAGNIGYSVWEEYRGSHYALKACLLLEQLARRHHMDRLRITCNPDNFPSRRTCELFGATYLCQLSLPEDNEMYLLGEREKRIYEKQI